MRSRFVIARARSGPGSPGEYPSNRPRSSISQAVQFRPLHVVRCQTLGRRRLRGRLMTRPFTARGWRRIWPRRSALQEPFGQSKVVEEIAYAEEVVSYALVSGRSDAVGQRGVVEHMGDCRSEGGQVARVME